MVVHTLTPVSRAQRREAFMRILLAAFLAVGVAGAVVSSPAQAQTPQFGYRGNDPGPNWIERRRHEEWARQQRRERERWRHRQNRRYHSPQRYCGPFGC